MTLNTLTTRYVKLVRKTTVIGVSLLVIVSLLGVTRYSEASGVNPPPGAADKSIPTFKNTTVEQKLTASDGVANDSFGHSVAFSDSTAVVGASSADIGGNADQGSAYIFNRQGGSWVEAQKLSASDGAAGDAFGWSVAVSGSTVVVGAIGSNSFRGSVYIFNRQGGSWVLTQKLTASDGAAGDRFGLSIAISDSTVVVAAIGSNAFQGSAYVFNRQGRNWVEAQKLTASDGAAGDRFGWSIAINGSTIVVGTAILNALVEGSAYIFNQQGESWVETQKLTASDGAGGNIFGWSVAISGSTIVVTAWGDTVDGNFNQGSAYVFNRQGESWVETQKLTASDGAPFDEFGWSVAISGSTIVVGSQVEAVGGNTAQGSAYVFNRHAGNWVETQKLTASDGAAGDRFGWSIAVGGSTIFIGAIGSNSFQGAVYVFEPGS